jgi:hypothetical protein
MDAAESSFPPVTTAAAAPLARSVDGPRHPRRPTVTLGPFSVTKYRLRPSTWSVMQGTPTAVLCGFSYFASATDQAVLLQVAPMLLGKARLRVVGESSEQTLVEEHGVAIETVKGDFRSEDGFVNALTPDAVLMIRDVGWNVPSYCTDHYGLWWTFAHAAFVSCASLQGIIVGMPPPATADRVSLAATLGDAASVASRKLAAAGVAVHYMTRDDALLYHPIVRARMALGMPPDESLSISERAPNGKGAARGGVSGVGADPITPFVMLYRRDWDGAPQHWWEPLNRYCGGGRHLAARSGP